MFSIEVLGVGYGLVDLACVSHFGAIIVASVGMGELVFALLSAFFLGIVDVFGARWARLEGAATANFWQLLRAVVPTIVAWTILAWCVAFMVPWGFSVAGVNSQIVGLASRYTQISLLGIPFLLLQTLASSALRIVGRKGISVALVAVGFALNGTFDAIVIFTPMTTYFADPAAAVACATVSVQVIMGLIGWIILRRHIGNRNTLNRNVEEGHDFGVQTAFTMSVSVGVRHLNDYAASVVPLLFIGRLQVTTVAAATVATNIWTLYCRVPQSCLTAGTIHLAYARGESADAARLISPRIFRYVAAPSMVLGLLMIPITPLFVKVLGGGNVGILFTSGLTVAFLVAIPAYVVENFSAEILTIEQEGSWLSLSSTIATYAVAIPWAVVSIFVFHSAVGAILSAAVASLVLATIYGLRTQQLGYPGLYAGGSWARKLIQKFSA